MSHCAGVHGRLNPPPPSPEHACANEPEGAGSAIGKRLRFGKAGVGRGGAGRGDCQLTEAQIASRDNGRRRRLWWGRKSFPGGSPCSRRGTGPPQHHGDHRQHAARAGEFPGRGPDEGSGVWDRAPLLSSSRGPSRVARRSRSCAVSPSGTLRSSDSGPEGLAGGRRQRG